MGNLLPALGALTGGGTGALDKIDGAGLNDGDAAVVVLSTGVYYYHLNEASGAAENSPYVIAPNTNPGNKRWILVTPQAPFSHVEAHRTTAQSLTNSTSTTIVFSTEGYDYLGEYDNSTGIFSPKHNGLFSVKALVSTDSYTWNVGTKFAPFLSIDGTTKAIAPQVISPINYARRVYGQIITTVPINVGEDMIIRVFHNQGGAVNTNTEDPTTAVKLTIDRIA